MFEDAPAKHEEQTARLETWREAMRAGMTLMASGASAEAIAHFERAVAERPDHVPTALTLAAALKCAGDDDRALAAFEAILRSDPDAPEAHHGRGLALQSLERREAALEAFRRATRLAPDFARSWASIADITPDEAERLHAVGETARARECACRADRVETKDFQKCVAALLAAKRHAEAAEFVEANRDRFDETTYHDQLARCHYRQGAFEPAFREKLNALRSLDVRSLPAARKPARFDSDAAIEAVAALCRILESQGVRGFLAAGTLLGMWREGRPLGHDRDADIGVIRGPDIAGVIRRHPELMLEHDARPGDRYFALTFRKVAIDIFVHDVRNDHLVCGVSDTPGDIQWRFSPFSLRLVEIAGREWTIPHNAERYLSESYGRGWRTPDTGFASAISSPALSGVNRYARAYYAATRAKTALVQGDVAKAKALLGQCPAAIDPFIIENLFGGDDMQTS